MPAASGGCGGPARRAHELCGLKHRLQRRFRPILAVWRASFHSLLLSALEKIADRMYGASLRSDDQSRRPFAIAGIDSSIEPSVRSPAEPRETMLRLGSLELDLINRTAKRGDRPIDLLPSEFRLLKYMMQKGGQLLTRAQKLLQGRMALQIPS